VDPFDDPTRWQIVDEPAGSIDYAEGTLRATIAEPGTALWTTRALGDAVPVMRVETGVTVSSEDGSVGVMCGAGGATPAFLLGGVTTRNTWFIATLVDGVATPVAVGPLPLDMDIGGGGTATIALECAATGTDAGDRAALWVDDRIVADATTGGVLGAWDRAGLYGAVTVPLLVAGFDDAQVKVGQVAAEVVADAAILDLMARIPAPWRDACTATRSVGGAGVVAGVVCAPAGGADQAAYFRYGDPASLDDAFRSAVEGAGQPLTTDDCAVGPSDVTWSVSGGSQGRLACFEDPSTPGRLLIVWTDDALGALAIGTRTGTGYAELYDWWLGAGLE
jgi:hypothetical protein